MLTYTFSTREKVLLVVLAFVGLAIAWYQLVFVNIQNQISKVNSDIANVENELLLYQTEMSSLSTMRAEIERYEAQGYEIAQLPDYDNTQSLMAFLNGVLAGSQDFSISFDEPVIGDDGLVHRTGTITYSCGSYEEARGVAENIARGPYPCRIESLGIADSTKKGASGSVASGSGAFKNTVMVTFYERPTGSMSNVSTQGNTSQSGQDLSKMSDWNK